MSEVKALLVFCEGPHDVAFVQKVLTLCLGFEKMTWKFSQYPSPFNSLFKMSVQDHAAGDLTLDMAHKFFLPDSVLQKSDHKHLVLLFNSGGSSNIKEVKSLLKGFLSLLEQSSVFPDNSTAIVTQAKYLFIYDADHNGTTKLFKKIKNDFESIDEQSTWFFNELNMLSHNHFAALADDKAAYIWGENIQTGTLEDILLPMVEKDQKEIVEKAINFIDNPLFKWETSSTDTQRKIAQISKWKKAVITCVGQKKYSGASLKVIIEDKDKGEKLIKDNTFKDDPKAKDFADFIAEFMK